MTSSSIHVASVPWISTSLCEDGDTYADSTLTAIDKYSRLVSPTPGLIIALLGDARGEAPLYISSIHYYDETSLGRRCAS